MTAAAGFLSDEERTVGKLEKGTIVTKFYSGKKKPEKKILGVARETMRVIWYRSGNDGRPPRREFEGSLDIRTIKEVRQGKNSKDFAKWPDECKSNSVAARCFAVFHGSEFNLKTLSVIAISKDEMKMWIKGLKYLMSEVKRSSYILLRERWMRKGFYQVESQTKENSLSIQDLKRFFQRVNCKIGTAGLKEKFSRHDGKKNGFICFDDFSKIVQEVLYQRTVFEQNFKHYFDDKDLMSVSEFQRFLREEQNEDVSLGDLAEIMRRFLQDPSREVDRPYFTNGEFMDWLYAKENTHFDEMDHSVVSQDMTRPLSHYWINSSHNTYLTGDQISSESSADAYARCLRMGCRSVELDCWDGPDKKPFIYHGHTLTSKIKFVDVVNTIKEHAFVTSDYPLILSIEDHCSLAQQRIMASVFQEVFGDMLIKAPLEPEEEVLPSPEKLRGKIILKHKKLPEGDDNAKVPIPCSSSSAYDPQTGGDIANSVKNGILYVEDEETGKWMPHFFVLTSSNMYYSEVSSSNASNDNEDESEDEDRSDITGRGLSRMDSISSATATYPEVSRRDESELHFSEPWFHRIVRQGRVKAEELLLRNKDLGDGTFLVRPSETFIGAYSLSFLRKGAVYHVPIKDRQQENGTVRYYLIDQVLFDSLYSLITHYQTHPLRSAKFAITLGKAVPPPNQHEGKVSVCYCCWL